MKLHTAEWFAEKERLLWRDPTANTVSYYTRRSRLKIIFGCIFIPLLFGLVLLVLGLIERRRLKKYLSQYTDWQNECLGKGRTVTFDGAPGTGKTFSGSNIAYELARARWAELESEYLLQRTMITRWVMSGNTEKLSQFRALEEAFWFYKQREMQFIPCLFSSIPLQEFESGRFSYVLEPEMFLQLKRVPDYTVLFSDELGQIFGNDKSYSTNTDFSDLWRFIRHFFDGMAVNTNQAADQAAIQARRSTDYVNHLFGQEWVMEPVALENRIARKERRYYKKLFKGRLSDTAAEQRGQELYYLKRYAKTIGFRQVTHQLKTTEGVLVGETQDYIFPALGGVNYDDRCFRDLYKCKDKEIEASGWDRLTVETYDRGKYDDMVMSARASVSKAADKRESVT